MKYRSGFYHSKSDEDLGLDLYCSGDTEIPPLSISVVGTNTAFGFPIYGIIRRFIFKLLYGMECTGVGGLVKPRSRHDYQVLAGVIDAGYRGEIKVKIYNPTDNPLKIKRGDKLAQMILIPVLHPTLRLGVDLGETKRGRRGGINNVR